MRRAAVKATLPRSLAQAMDGLSGPALALVALAVEGAEWAGVSAEPEGPCSARSQGAGICVPLGASWKDPRLPLGTCLSSLPCTPSPQPLPQHLQETGVQGPACPDGLG